MLENLLFADTVAGMFLDTLTRAIHTICGATLLGGAMYMRFVLAPAVPAEGDADAAEQTLFAGRRQAWSLCVAVCAGLLLLSGSYNWAMVSLNYEKMARPYQALLGVKFLVAIAVMAVAAMIAGRSAGAKKMQQGATKWLNILLLLVVSVFVLGSYLKNIPHVPKGEAPTSEAPAFDPAATDAGESYDATQSSIPTLPGPGE